MVHFVRDRLFCAFRYVVNANGVVLIYWGSQWQCIVYAQVHVCPIRVLPKFVKSWLYMCFVVYKDGYVISVGCGCDGICVLW